MFMESWILQVSCKVNVKPFRLHLLCKRPEAFMIPWTSLAKLAWNPSGITYFARDPKYSWFHGHTKNRTHFLNDNWYSKVLTSNIKQCITCYTLLHRALLTSFLCWQNETTVDIESAGHVSVNVLVHAGAISKLLYGFASVPAIIHS